MGIIRDMQMEKYNSMTVYRASAGSGKTFTLAIRYIELLIKNPTAYRETLAVTFTNKATEEMKMRILSQLYGLSRGLNDSNNYLQRIINDLGISTEEVREKAGQALHYILHDYSNFNVETIDAFFQRILRNLARELDLNSNLRVELNSEEIEEMAVDKLISELKANDKVLLWITDHIKQKLEDDEGWNVIDSIKEFGKKIFKQEYKKNAKDINKKFKDKNFFSNYQSSLRNIIKEADEAIKKETENFFKLLEDNGYSAEQLKKTGGLSYFKKLSKGEYTDTEKVLTKAICSAFESIEGWVNKADQKKPVGKFAEQTLIAYINQTEKKRKECAKRRNSAQVILKHLNELRLLHNIEQTVEKMNKEDNRFLLSDTQNILHGLMKDDDAPFIFEKIGGRIKHTMIDEFQDTSVIQWENFKKLLMECMANQGSENLIVGDVKQSIYRWRNGDWSLLNNKIFDDLKDKDVKLENLNVNYRSEANIINFNNVFFTQAASVAQSHLEKDADIISQIYSKELVEQKYPEGKEQNGYVEITLLPDTDYAEGCKLFTKQHIETLLEAGAKDEDIAILVRDNTNISNLANWLQTEMPDHTFVSDDAFRLESSIAVNVIIDAMRVLLAPKDNLIRARLAKEYQNSILGNDVTELPFKTLEGINKHLPFDFHTKKEHLLSLPLNDLAENLSVLFQLHKLESEAAYINYFFDQINTFTKNNIPDLPAFIEAWDERLYKKTVKGGNIQGIRLITIHKSKGLEFNHVIIPFCDWTLDRGDTLWCQTSEEPFTDIPVVPVQSKKLKDTIFDEAYHEEKLQNSIDNLNMLYVAFTRAGQNLYVIGRNSMSDKGLSKHKRSGLIQEVIQKLASSLPGCVIEGDTDKKGGRIVFAYGEMYVKNKPKQTSDNVFLKSSEEKLVGISAEISNPEFRQSNQSRAFVAGEEQEPENQKYITQGTVLHNLLSRIKDASQVEHVLNEFLQEGILSESDASMSPKTLSKLIKQRIEHNESTLVNRWFSKDVEVMNECSILCTNPQTGLVKEFRPDRVVFDNGRITVIDFKFGNAKESYHSQVREYMALLRDMGYAEVDGYLWYVYKNKVEEVKVI